ncbi:hypothetical protein AHF37_09141 [Paragonimus kellicotti]|nr:hypothetical protein AHF37_09141 [Paragonimus kellicotti]
MHRYNEFALPHTLRVFVGTWNVNGGKHFHSVAHKHESVTDWLLDLVNTVKPDAKWGYKNPSYDDAQLRRPLDVFAIGFEEIVDLTTSNIVAGSKPTANQRDWGQFLQRHLNRDVHQRDAYTLISSISRDARRKVVLDCLRDYGPIDATVAVSLSLVNSISQQPVALKDLPINLFRRFDFIDDLKAVGGLTKGVVLLVHFLTADTALFTYENAK